MKFEHFALNVEDPLAMAAWYVEQLGLEVVRQLPDRPWTTFLADSSGTIMLELNNNPATHVPDYQSMHPLLLHLAFVSEAPAQDIARLTPAGAELVSDQQLEDGSHLVMMRDPWQPVVPRLSRATTGFYFFPLAPNKCGYTQNTLQ